MSLTTLGLLTGPTISPSGGSALAFTSQGVQGDKNRFICDADTDLRTQRVIELSCRRPRAQASAPNGYTQARVSGFYKIPRILANGNISVDTISVTISTDVETTVAQKSEMLLQGAQLFIDSELLGAWTQQNMG